MSDQVAFRFLGHMFQKATPIAQAAGSKNIPKLAIEVGISLIDLANSTISYSSTRKGTAILEKQFESINDHYNQAEKKVTENYEIKKEMLAQKFAEQLKTEKQRLKNELEGFKAEIDVYILNVNYKWEENVAIRSQLMKMVRMFNEILEEIYQYIQSEQLENNEVHLMLERYRILQKKVNEIDKQLI